MKTHQLEVGDSCYVAHLKVLYRGMVIHVSNYAQGSVVQVRTDAAKIICRDWVSLCFWRDDSRGKAGHANVGLARIVLPEHEEHAAQLEAWMEKQRLAEIQAKAREIVLQPDAPPVGETAWLPYSE